MTAAAVDSTQALRERVIDAASRRSTMRIVGAGTWLDAGRPVDAAETISTRELSGIVEYVPGDLTLTARAGTTLGDIRAATLAHGQWLALEPYGDDRGTLGATIATASAGPLATAFGSPRDLTLGVEFVMGTGILARGGGRVVKNVAGFDLTRLLTGSWGTLGIIAEVAVRLHAQPEVDATYAVPLDGVSVGRVRQYVQRLPFTPFSCEILNSALATRLVAIDRETVLFRLGGNTDAVTAQRTALSELGDVQSVASDVWEHLRAADGQGAVTFRLSRLSSEIENTWDEATAALASCAGALIHASPARGIVRCIVPPDAESIAALRSALAVRSASTRVGERLAAELWPLVSAAPASDALSRRIKRTFDPAGVLNPGIFGDQPDESP